MQRMARVFLMVMLLAAACLACITGGGGGDGGQVATQQAEADAQDATATFGAQVFEAQLTAIMQP
jgi:hypothetical protein